MVLDSPEINMIEEPTVQGGPPGFGGYGDGGMLPWFVVVPVQLASLVWELGVVAIVTLPWWSMVASIALLDFILDWVFLFTIGMVCKPCASIFIWLLNIAMIPFMLIGYFQRLYYEIFGAVIDGWLLAFKFSGCFWIFGHHCWFTHKGRHTKARTAFDIPLLNALTSANLLDAIKEAMTPVEIEDNRHFLEVRAANREPLLRLLPGYNELDTIYHLVSENVNF